MTPCRKESKLKQVLSELCPGTSFDDAVVSEYYMELASIISGWVAEQARLEASPVRKALLTLAKDLNAASALLSGSQTGERSDLEIEITSRVEKLMALNPAIGSREAARDRLGSFTRDAEIISHACLIAAFVLPSAPERRGPKRKDWYHSLTRLLVSIAKQAGVEPTLYKDRSEDRSPEKGWLLDAARALETFLPREMRSPSDVARYKRLERAIAVKNA